MTAQVVIQTYPLKEVDEDDDEPAEVLRVQIPAGTAQAFAKRTREVADSGRPICLIGGHPLDPNGQPAPRSLMPAPDLW